MNESDPCIAAVLLPSPSSQDEPRLFDCQEPKVDEYFDPCQDLLKEYNQSGNHLDVYLVLHACFGPQK